MLRGGGSVTSLSHHGCHTRFVTPVRPQLVEGVIWVLTPISSGTSCISSLFPLKTKQQHCLGWRGWGWQDPAPQHQPLPGSAAPWTRLLLSSFQDRVLWQGKGPWWSLGDLQERQGWEMGTQTHGLHRKRGSGGPVIYLC